jgi:RNA polymerase sigma-70 factor (ECF subfamily)
VGIVSPSFLMARRSGARGVTGAIDAVTIGGVPRPCFDEANDVTFEDHRSRLFGIAYRMLGSVHDAEDVVQDAFVRWQQADAATLHAPEGWLVAVTTRLAIDRLRRAATERQAYVGEWLPEPLATGAATDRPSELASDLSVAFLLLLERLAPEERAAFLLREVFDRGYDEIADIVGRSPANARQMVHRARDRVRADGRRLPVEPDAKQRLLERFVAALHADDEAALLALLAPQAVMRSDSGGKIPAARKVLVGADHVARFLLGTHRKWNRFHEHRFEMLNGEPALVSLRDGDTFSTTAIDTDGERILAVYRVLNPDKLRHARAARA